ncbi:MAG TPA: PIG-L deacetylase family protein [Thermoplasmata archaeon]|nr:PIG-L deacetylase family protein [Thermoplasmata archaeon]
MVRRAPREVRDLFGDRLLVAGAHPDDVELMAGGLLAQWSGSRKAVVVTTMKDFDAKRQARREREIAAAMKVLGIEDFAVGPHRDADLVHDSTLTKYFEALLREFRPTLVVTHKGDDFHQDHRAISQAVTAALRRTDATLLHGESYLWALDEPSLYVDISRGLRKKVQALSCYKSIIANGTFDPAAVRAFHRMRGHQTFRYEFAEAFRLVRGYVSGSPRASAEARI